MLSLLSPLLFALLAPLGAALRYQPRGHYHYPGNTTSYAPAPTAPPPPSQSCYTTQFPAICDYGLCESTYSWTEHCGPYGCPPPSTETDHPPPGFTTTVTLCAHCGYEVTTVTLTVPVTAVPVPHPYPTGDEPEPTHVCEGGDCGPAHTHATCDGPHCPSAAPTAPDHCEDAYGYCPEPAPTATATATTEHCHGAHCHAPQQTYPVHCDGDAYCPEPTPECSGAYCPAPPPTESASSVVPELPTYTGAAAPMLAGGNLFAAAVAALALALL